MLRFGHPCQVDVAYSGVLLRTELPDSAIGIGLGLSIDIGIGSGSGLGIPLVCEDLGAMRIEIDLEVAITSHGAQIASQTIPMPMPTAMPTTMPMTSHASTDGLDNRGSNSAMRLSERHWG
jgi:hypothetical protein